MMRLQWIAVLTCWSAFAAAHAQKPTQHDAKACQALTADEPSAVSKLEEIQQRLWQNDRTATPSNLRILRQATLGYLIGYSRQTKARDRIFEQNLDILSDAILEHLPFTRLEEWRTLENLRQICHLLDQDQRYRDLGREAWKRWRSQRNKQLSEKISQWVRELQGPEETSRTIPHDPRDPEEFRSHRFRLSGPFMLFQLYEAGLSHQASFQNLWYRYWVRLLNSEDPEPVLLLPKDTTAAGFLHIQMTAWSVGLGFHRKSKQSRSSVITLPGLKSALHTSEARRVQEWQRTSNEHMQQHRDTLMTASRAYLERAKAYLHSTEFRQAIEPLELRADQERQNFELDEREFQILMGALHQYADLVMLSWERQTQAEALHQWLAPPASSN